MTQQTQASVLEVTTAQIETTCTVPLVAELTDEVNEILDTVEVGDRLSVSYDSLSTLPTELHGRVTDVDRESGDIRLATNTGTRKAYLHINPKNGTYFFDDHFDRTPEDGFTITSVALRAVRD